MTETATEHAELFAALDAEVTEEERIEEAEKAERRELEEKIQQAAPEALRGDESARAALDEAETALFALDKRQRLRQYAAAEEARREQAKLTAEQEAQRQVLRDQQAKLETEVDEHLRVFEKLMPAALDAALKAVDANSEASSLQSRIQPGSGMHYRRLHRQLESRIVRLVWDHVALRLDVLHPGEGVAPLVEIAPAKRTAKK